MMTVKEARKVVLQTVPLLGTETVALFDALGRVLAETIYATRDQPPWDNSAMDGYAVRSRDTRGATPDQPVELAVVADLPAGQTTRQVVGPGEAIRIMTGAPIPRGVDTIVREEDTAFLTTRRVRVLRVLKEVPPGQDIRRAGEDLRMGDRLLEPGQVIRAAEVGLMASTKRRLVRVYRLPRVAIVSTGDELVDVDDPLPAGKIVDSNSYSLTAQVLEAGALPIRLGIARDRPEDLEHHLRQGLDADVLISSGGVSIGAYDYVREVLQRLGIHVLFWQVAMRPGRPLLFGQVGEKIIFGLPGNPVASMVTFELFVRPALRRMTGHRQIYRRLLRANLENPLHNHPGRMRLVRVVLREENGIWYTSSTGAQGSGILRSMSRADGLAVIPADKPTFVPGEMIDVMPLDDRFGTAAERPF